MGTPSDIRQNGSVIRFDPEIFDTIDFGLFDADWLRSNHTWKGSAEGRGEAHFLTHAGRDMVLRHFRRGGLVGRVNQDRYLRTGAMRSRAFREFDLLQEMLSEGLPVPRPMAAQYAPTGLFYRAAIITERVPNAQPLQAVLSETSLTAHMWAAIGNAIGEMHEKRVFHSDLNSRNILLDSKNSVWLIDFDKCERRAQGTWTQANLERLRRSLRKSAGQSQAFHWREDDWVHLIEGYASAYRPS